MLVEAFHRFRSAIIPLRRHGREECGSRRGGCWTRWTVFRVDRVACLAPRLGRAKDDQRSIGGGREKTAAVWRNGKRRARQAVCGQQNAARRVIDRDLGLIAQEEQAAVSAKDGGEPAIGRPDVEQKAAGGQIPDAVALAESGRDLVVCERNVEDEVLVLEGGTEDARGERHLLHSGAGEPDKGLAVRRKRGRIDGRAGREAGVGAKEGAVGGVADFLGDRREEAEGDQAPIRRQGSAAELAGGRYRPSVGLGPEVPELNGEVIAGQSN